MRICLGRVSNVYKPLILFKSSKTDGLKQFCITFKIKALLLFLVKCGYSDQGSSLPVPGLRLRVLP